MDFFRYNSKRGLRSWDSLFAGYIRRRFCEVLLISRNVREDVRGVDGNPRAEDGKP